MAGKGRLLYVGLDSGRLGIDWEGEVVHFPLIQTRLWESPLNYLAEIEQSTHLLFTSREAVKYFFDFDIQVAGKKIIAVGKGTAGALKGRSGEGVMVAEEESAEGVVRLLERMDRGGMRIFWPHSLISRAVIVDYLKREKVSFCECFLYETRNVAVEEIPDLNEFEAVYFTSSSTVDAFFQIYRTIPSHIRCIAIGPITNARLEKHLPPLQSRGILATVSPQEKPNGSLEAETRVQ